MSKIGFTKAFITIVKGKRRNCLTSKSIGFVILTVQSILFLGYTSRTIIKLYTDTVNSRELLTASHADTELSHDESKRKQLLILNEELNKSRFVHSKIYDNTTTITWTGLDIETAMNRYWSGKILCEIGKMRSIASNRSLPITVNIIFSCGELFHHGLMGTGNYIALLYGIRLTARIYGNVDVAYICTDADETKKDLVLPWLMGWFPGRPMEQNSSIPISSNGLCNGYYMPRLTYMFNEIRYDLRKMAIALMGIPGQDHPGAKFAESTIWSESFLSTRASTYGVSLIPPPKPNAVPLLGASRYELDDAVLHFRCGDLMDSDHKDFAFMHFYGYTRYISPEAKNIGIITQPFDDNAQTRSLDMDQSKRDRCRVVVHSLVKYIEKRHPRAKVSIRNDVTDTIAVTFARMIMANQTISGISTFGVMPAIATFGTGYIRSPEEKTQNRWLEHPRIDHFTDNVILFEEPDVILVSDMKKLWESEGEVGVLSWFWNDSMVTSIS
jgi:hypothetical protein